MARVGEDLRSTAKLEVAGTPDLLDPKGPASRKSEPVDFVGPKGPDRLVGLVKP